MELFAQLTSRYELLFCYTILEQNKRLVLSTGSSLGGGATVTAAQTANPLDCFFPFDPYTLKRYTYYCAGLIPRLALQTGNETHWHFFIGLCLGKGDR